MNIAQYTAAVAGAGGISNVDYVRLAGAGRSSALLNVRNATVEAVPSDGTAGDEDILKITLATGQVEVYILADVVGLVNLPVLNTTPYDIWTDAIANRG